MQENPSPLRSGGGIFSWARDTDCNAAARPVSSKKCDRRHCAAILQSRYRFLVAHTRSERAGKARPLAPLNQTWDGFGCTALLLSGTPVRYSITSSARAITVGGILRLRALAVLRLMTSSNLLGACTGRSPGFSPLRIR